MKMFILIGTLGAVVGLTACTDQNLDACGNANRDVNLANLAGNAISGSDTQCIANLQQELNTLRLEGRLLQAEESRLRQLSASLSGEERAAAERLARLNATQSELAARIASRGSNTSNDANVARVLSEERSLRTELERGGNGIDTQTAAALAQRQRQLDQLTLDLL